MLSQEPITNFSMPQILGEEIKIKEEKSLACISSSVGVSKSGVTGEEVDDSNENRS